MYGTIFKLKIKDGHEDQLLNLMKENIIKVLHLK